MLFGGKALVQELARLLVQRIVEAIELSNPLPQARAQLGRMLPAMLRPCLCPFARPAETCGERRRRAAVQKRQAMERKKAEMAQRVQNMKAGNQNAATAQAEKGENQIGALWQKLRGRA